MKTKSLASVISLLTLACFAFLPASLAQLPSPAPDGGYPNENTAEGDGALSGLTTGADNTAIGFDALSSDSDGNNNTAIGAGALKYNNGSDNTAVGTSALATNTGIFNTAVGIYALLYNTSGFGNTAIGNRVLEDNTTGVGNTANGDEALGRNTTGKNNTASGEGALFNNTTGNHNIAIGAGAGERLTTGSNNIEIGNRGVASDANTIRIGVQGTQKSTFVAGIYGATVAGGAGVMIDNQGHLGTLTSSARFKDEIKPMDKASEAILALKPVTFHYKHELDPAGIPQFGLAAEEVEKVNPALVARDADGKVYTVRYEAVNAMLLNEFLKEHQRVQAEHQRVQALRASDTEQKKEIAELKRQLQYQAEAIRKVSERVGLGRPAPRLVATEE